MWNVGGMLSAEEFSRLHGRDRSFVKPDYSVGAIQYPCAEVV